MRTPVPPEIWWLTFGLLALESALVIAVAALCHRLTHSALWHRTIWQGCVMALLTLITMEFCGGIRAWIPATFSTSASSAPLFPHPTPPAESAGPGFFAAKPRPT